MTREVRTDVPLMPWVSQRDKRLDRSLNATANRRFLDSSTTSFECVFPKAERERLAQRGVRLPDAGRMLWNPN